MFKIWGKKVLISSVMTRKSFYMDKRRLELNQFLQGMCNSCGFHFIDNDNIFHEHLVNDGVRLNDDGSILLAKFFFRIS